MRDQEDETASWGKDGTQSHSHAGECLNTCREKLLSGTLVLCVCLSKIPMLISSPNAIVLSSNHLGSCFTNRIVPCRRSTELFTLPGWESATNLPASEQKVTFTKNQSFPTLQLGVPIILRYYQPKKRKKKSVVCKQSSFIKAHFYSRWDRLRPIHFSVIKSS